MAGSKKLSVKEITEKIYNALSQSDHQLLFEKLTLFEKKKEFYKSVYTDSSDDEEAGPTDEVVHEPDPESDPDDEWGVVTIEDDNEEEKVNGVRKEMVCYRCPNRSEGTFKDLNKFKIHVKRHVFGEHFCCVTCGRPFTKIGHCISHEMRVHGTEVEYDNRDPVISYAKKYILEKKLKKNESKQETDEETDCEDSKFYGNKVVSSSAQYAYKGPPVGHMIESYEIEYYHSRRKRSRGNFTAKFALEQHEFNVENYHDDNRLGKFGPAPRKKQAPPKKKEKKAPVPKKRPVAPDPSVKKPPPVSKKQPRVPTVKKPPPLVPSKRPRAPDPTEKKEEPKKKRVKYITSSSSSESDVVPLSKREKSLESEPKKKRVKYMTSSSDSNVSPVSKLPSEPKTKRRKVRYITSSSSSSDDDVVRLSKREKVVASTSKGRMADGGKSFVGESALLCRVCRLCQYMWKTEVDLRVHRDKMHSTLPLMDLMAVTVEKPKHSSSVKKPVGSNKMSKPRKKKLGKGPRPRPIPTQSFTEKENFLHSLGLVNVIRLHIHLNKPVNMLNLPSCSVRLERLII